MLPACLFEWPEKALSCFLPKGKGEHLPDYLPEMLLTCCLPGKL